ncbi:MAG: ABC transporter substrate-binding protein [Desulfitobacteriaceae bacterium]|nr:ABC transporter substrate-binding protein [Desulfitobacteriaceae bacterium]MDD4753397.1 ABC transporter substrate-binding protein [Desulfitobacteriaceae bacterium]
MKNKSVLKILVLVISIGLLLTGCASQGNQESSSGEEANDAVKIGIIQIVEHPSLDAARLGFLDALAAEGYEEGKNLTVNYQNAQGDMPTLNTIAKNLVAEGNDLVLAIATSSAQAMANAGKNSSLPILFTAVTDPVAAGLVKSMEKPDTNLTGTTDMAPVKDQIKLIQDIKPDVKNIGVIYNTSEVNSVVQVELTKQAAAELGLNIVEGVATNSSEVDQAAKSLVGKVDAIYVPTDNAVVSALESVINVAKKNKLLLVSAESDSVKRGTAATIGLDYYKLGEQTGKMAIKILSGAGKPQDMPVESQEGNQITVNQKAAADFDVVVPESILGKATEVIK